MYHDKHTHTLSLFLSETKIFNKNNGAAEDILRYVRHAVMVSSSISRFSGTPLVLSVIQSNTFLTEKSVFCING
jgi:hypothetical protein